MLKPSTLLVIFFILSYGGIDAVTHDNYVITRNVDSSIFNLQTAKLRKNVINVQICSQFCTAETDCHNALYDVDYRHCHMFLNQPAKSLKILLKSKYVFIEDQCSTSYSAGSTKNFWFNCGDMGQEVYTDCEAAHSAGIRENGNYMLLPANKLRPVSTYCMFDANNGWTTLMKRVPRLGHFSFFRDWNTAMYGGGMLSTEFFLGNEYIYYFTRSNRKLVVMLEAWDGEVRYANYSTFYNDGVAQKYVLHISGYSGDAGDSMAYHNGHKWGTWDQDNDPYSGNCAQAYKAMWWYGACAEGTLLGRYFDGGVQGYSAGLTWPTWKGKYYSFKYVHFMVGR